MLFGRVATFVAATLGSLAFLFAAAALRARLFAVFVLAAQAEIIGCSRKFPRGAIYAAATL